MYVLLEYLNVVLCINVWASNIIRIFQLSEHTQVPMSKNISEGLMYQVIFIMTDKAQVL